jgi:hypothetical protein
MALEAIQWAVFESIRYISSAAFVAALFRFGFLIANVFCSEEDAAVHG